MGRQSRRRMRKLSKEEWMRYGRFLLIPLAVLVLVAVIAVVDKQGKKGEPDVETVKGLLESSAEGSSEEAENGNAALQTSSSEEGSDIAALSLKKDEIPELTALVEAYCQAKTDCDSRALAGVFGRGEISEAEAAQEQEKLELVRRMVAGYENISCYFMEGPDPATYVIYPYFEIRYQDASVLMPSLTWAYVKRGEDGKFYMTQTVSDRESEYIAKVSLHEDVKQLSAQIKAQGEEAAAADAVLQRLYGGMAEVPETPETETETSEGSSVEILLESTAKESQPVP